MVPLVVTDTLASLRCHCPAAGDIRIWNCRSLSFVCIYYLVTDWGSQWTNNWDGWDSSIYSWRLSIEKAKWWEKDLSGMPFTAVFVCLNFHLLIAISIHCVWLRPKPRLLVYARSKSSRSLKDAGSTIGYDKCKINNSPLIKLSIH